MVNGLELVEDRARIETIPGINANGQRKAEINRIVDNLDNTLDAIKDLLLAEGVYQMAAGNLDRSRAALKSLNDLGNPQKPEITDIPRTGVSLTHRMGVQLSRRGSIQLWLARPTSRSLVEPRINRWLISKFPNPNDVIIRVTWQDQDPDSGITIDKFDLLRLSQLGFQPIDLLYMWVLQRENQTDSELRYRVDDLIRRRHRLRDDQIVRILEEDRTGFRENEISIYALQVLVLAVGDVLLNARPMVPEDLVLPNSTDRQAFDTLMRPNELKERLDRLIRPMTEHQEELAEAISSIETKWMGLSQEQLQEKKEEVHHTLRKLREALMWHVELGWLDAVPRVDYSLTPQNIEANWTQGGAILKKNQARLEEMKKILEKIGTDPALSNRDRIDLARKVTDLSLGKSFLVLPGFMLSAPNEYQQAKNYDQLLAFAEEEQDSFPVEEWLQSLAPVRPRVAEYQKVQILSELLGTQEPTHELEPVQFPSFSTRTETFFQERPDRWLAVQFPHYYYDIDQNNDRRIPEDNLSLAFEYASDFLISGLRAGFIIDEWSELIPDHNTNLGVAMNYNKPNTEPPNALLLAISPTVKGKWEWGDVVVTVEETFDLAKKRLVDPDLLKSSCLNHFLPALLPAISLLQHGPSLDLGKNMALTEPGTDGLIQKDFTLDEMDEIDQLEILDTAALGLEGMVDE